MTKTRALLAAAVACIAVLLVPVAAANAEGATVTAECPFTENLTSQTCYLLDDSYFGAQCNANQVVRARVRMKLTQGGYIALDSGSSYSYWSGAWHYKTKPGWFFIHDQWKTVAHKDAPQGLWSLKASGFLTIDPSLSHPNTVWHIMVNRYCRTTGQ